MSEKDPAASVIKTMIICITIAVVAGVAAVAFAEVLGKGC